MSPDSGTTYIEVGDGGSSLTIDGPYDEMTVTPDVTTATACILSYVETPDYVTAKMENTSSLMGVQEAEFEGITVSWSYHPDNGFDVCCTRTDGSS